MPLRRWPRSRWASRSSPHRGNAAAPDAGLALGGPDGRGRDLWIHQIRLVGPWSPIHLLSIFTPIMLVLAVWYARRHKVRGHKIAMISIFCGALVIAGLFTFVPGRIMHTVFFGY